VSRARITLDDFLHVASDRLRTYGAELTEARRANAARTIERANELLDIAHDHGVRIQDDPRTRSPVRSGWRPANLNASTPNAAARSHHIDCRAVDVYDPDGDLRKWCVENEKTLEAVGLWMEDPGCTPSWCHLQTEPPGSGKRVFLPGRKFAPDERFTDWQTRLTARAPAALARRAPKPEAPKAEEPKAEAKPVAEPPKPVAPPKPESTAETAKPLPQRPVEPPRPEPAPPQKSLLRSRTIWGALLAGAATVAEAVRSNVAEFAAVFPQVQTPQGAFNTAWLLVGVTILALLWVIYARIDDRRKQRR
jgi:hypothetical protein